MIEIRKAGRFSHDPERVLDSCTSCAHELQTIILAHPDWDSYQVVKRLRRARYGNKTTTGRRQFW